MNSPNWKLFERVVAAIHIAKSNGAKVTWDEKIDGRQFDVVVRFSDGVYDYLTLIECKRYSFPVPIEKVEAFVTKSRAAKANKAVLISSSGFQSGCLKVARENGITLLTLSENMGLSQNLEGPKRLFWHAFEVMLEMPDNTRWVFPDLNGRLEYLLNHSPVTKEDGRMRSLASLIYGSLSEEPLIREDGPRSFRLDFENCRISVPHEFTNTPISAVFFKAIAHEEIISNEPINWDRSQAKKIARNYCLFDEIFQKETWIHALNLPLGLDTKLQAGKFYTNPNFGINYFVEKIHENHAMMWNLESYAHGNLIQTQFTQDLNEQRHYVEIINKFDLMRLEWMYRDLLKNPDLQT